MQGDKASHARGRWQRAATPGDPARRQPAPKAGAAVPGVERAARVPGLEQPEWPPKAGERGWMPPPPTKGEKGTVREAAQRSVSGFRSREHRRRGAGFRSREHWRRGAPHLGPVQVLVECHADEVRGGLRPQLARGTGQSKFPQARPPRFGSQESAAPGARRGGVFQARAWQCLGPPAAPLLRTGHGSISPDRCDRSPRTQELPRSPSGPMDRRRRGR